MHKMLIASARTKEFFEFSTALVKHDFLVNRVESGREGLEKNAGSTFDLVVIDELLPDMTGLEFAEKLIRADPMISCAVVSQLSPETFHEAGEGLGLLMQLPNPPGKSDAEALANRFYMIVKLMNG